MDGYKIVVIVGLKLTKPIRGHKSEKKLAMHSVGQKMHHSSKEHWAVNHEAPRTAPKGP